MDIKANMVSPFCENVEEILGRLTITNKDIKAFAYEFCAAFNLKIDGSKITEKTLSLSTINGYPAGKIAVQSMYTRRSGDSELTYIYENEFLINKERNSGKTGRNQRDSTKIATLIRTLRKEDEVPTEENIAKKLMREAKSALHPLYNSNRALIHFSLGQDEVISMAETILGVPHTGNYLDKTLLQKEYNKYVQKMKESGDAKLNIKRYERGITLVGIYYHNGGYGDNSPDCYFVADGTIKDREIELQSTLKRYVDFSTLPDLEVTAMMTRTYMQGKGGSSKTNAFGLALMDSYMSDLDITVGYRDNKFQWIVIPKEAPNA